MSLLEGLSLKTPRAYREEVERAQNIIRLHRLHCSTHLLGGGAKVAFDYARRTSTY
jgi:hypothetical protein